MQNVGENLGARPHDEAQPRGLHTGSHTSPGEIDVVATTDRIAAAVGTVIQGKPDVIHLALVALLAEGHLLVEDVPGVGKTMLSKALARALDCSVRRIQFTPDLLPSDVTGVSVFNQETRQFEFRPGGIFANIVIGDEINRASPKTQSAMLECMEEGQVTVDGTTYELARPFLVVATQNPIEMEGTYALPEAQRDRFLARVSMGYPVAQAEIDMLAAREARSPLDDLAPVASATEVADMIAAAARVHLSEPVQEYLVAISTATRNDASLRLGASPRATLHLARAARALAAMSGRDYVLPDDALALAPAVLTHRLVLTTDAQMAGRTVAEVLAAILERIPVPGTARAVAPPRR